MSESPNTTIEIAKMIIELLTDNSYSIVIIVLLVICRDAISSFISRLTSFSYKNGDSELGLNAASPISNEDIKPEIPNADEKPEMKDDEVNIENKVNEDDWLGKIRQAFDQGSAEGAEEAFKRYSLEEKDEIKLEENKAFYLYLRFEKAKDNSAINDLEELARLSKTENSKFNTLLWLSFCLSDGMQHKKEIDIWEDATHKMKDQSLVTKSVVQLAYVLNKVERSSEARKLLIKRLAEIKEDIQKSLIFEALSIIEDSLGSKTVSVYCKDKAVEYDPNNREELFNSAYSASEEGIDEVSISNYIQLIQIDGDNATALNNLAVRAREAGVKIKAIENYKKASELNHTLAMANQGYALLAAGFTEEAERIAQKAIELDDTHQNVYNLITEINKEKSEQKAKWEKLCKKSLKRQRMIRSYTERYYLGEPKELEGNWFTDEKVVVDIVIKGNDLEAKWNETTSNTVYTVTLTGKITGATFSGKYTKKSNSDSPNLLMNLASDKTCIGYLSDEKDGINLFSLKLNDDFSLLLSRKKA
jgi:tetratricopeptide (TPR) repeat protein